MNWKERCIWPPRRRTGKPGRNPFNSLVALYIVAEDPVSGVLVKLAGEGQLDEGTLQISTTFKNAPQVPFEELKLDLFGGPRASVTHAAVVRELCDERDVHAVVWDGPGERALPGAGLPGLLGCGWFAVVPAGLAVLARGSPRLAARTPRRARSRASVWNCPVPTGIRRLSAVTMHLPPGIAALLSSVELCSEAQAAADACPAGSEVGQATAIAGLGPEPYVQEGGRVFITGPYGGAPFGLEIVTPADGGPVQPGVCDGPLKARGRPEQCVGDDRVAIRCRHRSGASRCS